MDTRILVYLRKLQLKQQKMIIREIAKRYEANFVRKYSPQEGKHLNLNPFCDAAVMLQHLKGMSNSQSFIVSVNMFNFVVIK